MRHVLAPSAIPSLAGGVVEAALPAPLIPPARGVEGLVPRPMGAGARAVAIAPIADAAQEEHLPTVAAGADHKRSESTSPCGLPARMWTRVRRYASYGFWDRLNRVLRGSARGSGGVKPPGPHPPGALVETGLPYLSRPRQLA
jgi:hypothetical protein